jgi:hypothetical protein
MRSTFGEAHRWVCHPWGGYPVENSYLVVFEREAEGSLPELEGG